MSKATQGANGTVSIEGGFATYEPDGGFTGDDSFIYAIKDGNGGHDTATVRVSVEDGGAAGGLHVADLDGETTSRQKHWRVSVASRILDDTKAPVKDATVQGRWSNGLSGTASCSTDQQGWCKVSAKVPANTPSVRFTVEDVAHAILGYDAGSNDDPDGDSDGTVITVSTP